MAYTKKPVLMNKGHSSMMQTPPKAIDILAPYINPGWLIWECACGKGNLVKRLEELDFTVVGSDAEIDFIYDKPLPGVDCIITNPPYNVKDKFIYRCYELGKPFALLLPLTALESERRQSLYRRHGIELLIPNKRFNFETPSGQGSGSWFATAWFTWGLDLPDQLTFVEI